MSTPSSRRSSLTRVVGIVGVVLAVLAAAAVGFYVVPGWFAGGPAETTLPGIVECRRSPRLEGRRPGERGARAEGDRGGGQAPLIRPELPRAGGPARPAEGEAERHFAERTRPTLGPPQALRGGGGRAPKAAAPPPPAAGRGWRQEEIDQARQDAHSAEADLRQPPDGLTSG